MYASFYVLHTARQSFQLSLLQVQDFLIHFWQGMPTHMLPILGCQATVDLVVVCDFVLYRVRYTYHCSLTLISAHKIKVIVNTSVGRTVKSEGVSRQRQVEDLPYLPVNSNHSFPITVFKK